MTDSPKCCGGDTDRGPFVGIVVRSKRVFSRVLSRVRYVLEEVHRRVHW